MKRVLILLLSLSIFSLSFAFDIVGGGTYNTHNFDYYIDNEKSSVDEDIKEQISKGYGAYAGMALYLNHNLGIEGGIDWFNSSYKNSDDSFSISQNTFGPYGALKLKVNIPATPFSFDAKAGLIYYMNETTSKGSIGSISFTPDEKYTGMGYVLGAGFNYEIKNGFNINLNGNYRIAKLPLTEIKTISDDNYKKYEGTKKELDLSGMRIGIGLSLEF